MRKTFLEWMTRWSPASLACSMTWWRPLPRSGSPYADKPFSVARTTASWSVPGTWSWGCWPGWRLSLVPSRRGRVSGRCPWLRGTLLRAGCAGSRSGRCAATYLRPTVWPDRPPIATPRGSFGSLPPSGGRPPARSRERKNTVVNEAAGIGKNVWWATYSGGPRVLEVMQVPLLRYPWGHFLVCE